MVDHNKITYEDASPNPEYLIKSIAEQGYNMETSLADLMDNSISANADKIEVLIDTDTEPFILFLTDNGNGMDEETLKKGMQFPSDSPENLRKVNDLGRFGLGMKTASFAQTRCLTVLSRKKGEEQFNARTWDVGYLKKNGWKIIINSRKEIEEIVNRYKKLSESFLNKFEEFDANTIIVWRGLYKFEEYLEIKNRKKALKKEISEVATDYLSLVFHRFMERKKCPLQVRINNNRVNPFNPFPTEEKDFRPIEYKQKKFKEDVIRIEGYILPSRSIGESRKGLTKWTTKYRGLMDMEGLYVYRADRIILFGGWNSLIRKAPRLQLARLKVEIGNSVDHLLHLNVAKSNIIIPHDLKNAFVTYIEELKIEAEREYYNRGIRKFSGEKKEDKIQLFSRKATNKGTLLELNDAFPILESLRKSLDKEQKTKLNFLIRMLNTRVNYIRQTHQENEFTGIVDKDGLASEEIVECINQLLKNGISKEIIKKDILPNLGYREITFPDEIIDLLK